MNILLKCPTRSRPQKVIATLSDYIRLANQKNKIGVAISCDGDDNSMRRNLVQEELHRILAPTAWHRIFFGNSKTKIEACNADMSSIDYPWDIVMLVSDDMIPIVRGWDDIVRLHMAGRYPDTNGILWFNDGCQGENLNTLCIFGRKIYEEFGHIYHPEYKSLFCDTELTDRCRGDLKNRCVYLPQCIIRHEHPGAGYVQNNDELYMQNQRYWNADMRTYIRRKTYLYDWSVLIPTIPGREAKLQNLLESIREKTARIAPEIRVDICVEFDNRENSIGVKRQKLLDRAKGKYLSFIDDDDHITDAYVEDLRDMMRGNYDTMRLYGDIRGYVFIHSTAFNTNDYMATRDVPPVLQRPPNHLNPMLSDIAKLIRFKDATRGEDLDWTLALYKTGVLQSEYRTTQRTHYIYDLGDRPLDPSIIANQQTLTYGAMLEAVFLPAKPAPVSGERPVLRLTARGFVSK